MAKLSDVININVLAEELDLPDWDSVDEANRDYYDDAGRAAYDAFMEDAEYADEQADESQAEEVWQNAEWEAQKEVFAQWHHAVLRAAEDLFEKHELELVPRGKDDLPYEFKIKPLKSWKDAADQIRETINGVGYFHFYTLKEFLDSGPYTPRQAVLGHLHYIKDYPEVYGTYSARSLYERRW